MEVRNESQVIHLNVPYQVRMKIDKGVVTIEPCPSPEPQTLSQAAQEISDDLATAIHEANLALAHVEKFLSKWKWKIAHVNPDDQSMFRVGGVNPLYKYRFKKWTLPNDRG